MEWNRKIGVKPVNLIKTLMGVFPLVEQVRGRRAEDSLHLIAPYTHWHLLAFDSSFNVLLSRYMEELKYIPAKDLVILIGPVAREWINLPRR
ncbi:MAG: hypothetical protein K8I30_18705 [Anaerolineae bacterium]|nr:hypothetical protein [Anaerolineae bacterium]